MQTLQNYLHLLQRINEQASQTALRNILEKKTSTAGEYIQTGSYGTDTHAITDMFT